MISSFIDAIRSKFWIFPGLLLWAAFPPTAEKMDVLFALAPLIWLSRQGEVKKSFRSWFISGLAFWIASLVWMPAIIKNDGPWPLVVLGWFALAAYCALFFAAYGYLSARYWAMWISRSETPYISTALRIAGILLVEPILWCGLELIRSRLFGGFAWNQLGVVAVNGGFGSPAAVGGVYLCSAAIFLINGTIAGIIERFVASWKARMRKARPSDLSRLTRFRSFETLLAFALVWGIYQLPGERRSSSSDMGGLKVAMVQRNFPCCFRGFEENPYIAYSNLLANVEAFQPLLVVLPESAMSEFGPIDSPRAIEFAKKLSLRTGFVLAGGTRYGDGELFNSAALYNGDEFTVYDKVHLVPFGEFIPGDKLFPWLQKFAPVGSCTPGDGALLQLMGIYFGVGICYEDTDSALMRKYARDGAQFLCFITNDSWFSHSGEAEAHSWQAVARAIETGLPVVRTGNSGVTGTITPDGRANWLSGPSGRPLVDHRGVMFDRISIGSGSPEPTPYVLLGDLPLGVAFACTLIFMIYYKRYGR